MKCLKKLKNWWIKNQEKSTERYIEREEMKKELEEYKKDIDAIYDSSVMDFQERTPEKASLIQNMIIQRKLIETNKNLNNATWILAIATGLFTWATIIDSPNSSYLWTTLQGISTLIVYFIMIILILAFVWRILTLVYQHFIKIFLKRIIR